MSLIDKRYRVLRTLGEGGSARTLLCHDERTDRQVALMELGPEHLEDWKQFELFL